MFLSIIVDNMRWPSLKDGVSLTCMLEVILPSPIMLVYLVLSIILIPVLRLIMSVVNPFPNLLEVMS